MKLVKATSTSTSMFSKISSGKLKLFQGNQGWIVRVVFTSKVSENTTNFLFAFFQVFLLSEVLMTDVTKQNSRLNVTEGWIQIKRSKGIQSKP